MKGLDGETLRIGTVLSVFCHWLPQRIKAFEGLAPNIQLVLYQGDYSSIGESLRSSTVDFGFITPAAMTDIQTKITKEGRVMAVLPEGQFLAAAFGRNLS